jgi:EAL domain-containing protein (putative c-di-GMP-specific phosphodiesterase class I)
MNDKFLEQMDTQLTGWADPLARLRQALEQDEFALYCQPILGLGAAGGYPMGEVLVRMREEETALLPPGDFLPVFEHYRMMPQLDRWVVRNTIKRLAAGSRIPGFTVNLSSQTLADPEFPPFVGAELSRYKVSPASLMFELDESDVLHHQDWAARCATSFRALGVRLLVDGFGRRAVSFSIFEALEPAFVKVDGSITRKLLANEMARNKMTAVLRVGEAMGFSVIAECVEEQGVLVQLKALGVGYAQGFGIHKPHLLDKLAAPPA